MKMLAILRTCAIYILFAIGVIAFFAIPEDESPTWVRDIMVSKMIAAASLYAMSRCIRRCEK